MMPGGQRRVAVGWAPLCCVFAAVSLFLLWFYGNRPFFVLDEGILFDAAQRMLLGKRLYADFFGYMSPGSYWLQELALRLFGMSLRSGHAMMAFDFALQCALVLWLTSRIASRAAAWGAAIFFFALQASQPCLLIPYHWWDSVTLSFASAACCLQGFWSARRRWWIAGGALAAAAAFCTPSIGLIAGVTAVWILYRRDIRRFFGWYSVSGIIVALIALGYMQTTGILSGFVEQMQWLHANYSAVNHAPYGEINGGYRAILRGISGTVLVFRAGLIVCLAMPAILPILGGVGATIALLNRRLRSCLPADVPVEYLALCLAAFVASTYPRPNITHLAFVAPFGYVLVAALISWYLPAYAGRAAMAVIFPWCVAGFAQIVVPHKSDVRVESPVGTLWVEKSQAAGLDRLFSYVHHGERLYVHPYMPLFYFLTQAENASRYPYLQPSMMTHVDEHQALAGLEERPPKWILFLRLSPERYLELYPKATAFRFQAVEEWIERNYALVDPPVVVEDYALWRRKGEGQ
ncbi:MAG: hypothetical protein ABSG25_11230 [Bryobacteraceae bacterium]